VTDGVSKVRLATHDKRLIAECVPHMHAIDPKIPRLRDGRNDLRGAEGAAAEVIGRTVKCNREPINLSQYLAEFDFRYNTRKMSDATRTIEGLRQIEGKRLMRRDRMVS
jgi:hypothetical protein